MANEKNQKIVKYVIIGSPLAGAGLANLLPISAAAHQFLVLITLLWFQAFILIEVFSIGK